MVKVAMTGSTGLVGSRIVEMLHDQVEFIEITHDMVDLTDKDAALSVLKDISFDFFLHAAAYTNVDKAENEEREKAYALNVDATRNITDVVNAKKAKLLYISTDYVFDGTEPPYYEDSVTHPLSVYGSTKHEGEKIVEGNGMIVRIAFPYRAEFDKKNDFIRTIKSFMSQGKSLKMVTDAENTPTYIDDIALAIRHLIDNFSPEVFHIVGPQAQTPYEEGLLIAKTFGFSEELVGKTTFNEFYAGKAPRPQHMDIRSKKNTFVTMRSLEEGLQDMKKIMG